MSLTATAEAFRLAEVFTISRGSRTEAKVLTVTLTRDGITGRGECVPYARYGESMDSVADQVTSVADAVMGGASRHDLLTLLPAGAARNAVDAAMWDWEAKDAAKPVWELAGLPAPAPVTSAFTLSLGTPESMEAAATRAAARPLLKIKLGGGPEDIARIEAVRRGAPNAEIIVDANEGWSVEEYTALAPIFLNLGVTMVEQPFPAGDDAALAGLDRPLPVCADESCHDRASLPGLKGKYDMVNIKLDKTGGLTEALALRDAARAEGFTVMVGCMVGTSLAMAPAVLVAQGAELVDLDGPLLLAEDRTPPLEFNGSVLTPPVPALWG
ncbi:L-alanine-DL-glutamate epimerase-like enolase superfamily enzyme [Rubricella aquisinus]|uniref:Dipeptide epimerase n=1 Tax=Rubricella aquisinus TaxID=2028108 RepID=A0A840WXB4_9RHOB|nr:N-acetyl-D-Glu racemase DgcA [Rubricella aquisinus]MBB5514994.1 L-alanine-DL-glutamate epimerase-like enolase superfamily enzyme [Rubricella aquisinus]